MGLHSGPVPVCHRSALWHSSPPHTARRCCAAPVQSYWPEAPSACDCLSGSSRMHASSPPLQGPDTNDQGWNPGIRCRRIPLKRATTRGRAGQRFASDSGQMTRLLPRGHQRSSLLSQSLRNQVKSCSVQQTMDQCKLSESLQACLDLAHLTPVDPQVQRGQMKHSWVTACYCLIESNTGRKRDYAIIKCVSS